jgi:hypothetical protein
MKDWLVEAIDQVALGEELADSTVSCGQRFGLIAIDNAIEFMLVAYVEVDKQMVGGHKPGGIIKKDWDKTKATFPSLMAFVASLEPKLAALQSEILRYHDFRSDLYHSGTPKTTSANRVHTYATIALQVLDALFLMPITSAEWVTRRQTIAVALTANAIPQGLRRQVTYDLADDVVRFNCTEAPIAKHAIAIAIHGFYKLKATSPTRSQLIKTLALSGQSLSKTIVDARITDLRKSGWLQKNNLLLTGKGRKQLEARFIV